MADRLGGFGELAEKILNLGRPAEVTGTFAFEHQGFSTDYGWNVFDIEDEFIRLGALGKDGRRMQWRLQSQNNGGTDWYFCQSYGPLLCVPDKLNIPDLKAVSQFRSKGRIPVSLSRKSR